MEERTMETIIATEVEVTGTVKSKGAIRINGKLDGELLCEQDAVIGKEAVIKGNITAQSVTVEGTIQGNVTARDRVELQGAARMTGDVKAKRMVVQEGVTFVGRSDVNPSGAPATAPASARGKDAAAEKPADEPIRPIGATPGKDKEPDDRDTRSGIFGRR